MNGIWAKGPVGPGPIGKGPGLWPGPNVRYIRAIGPYGPYVLTGTYGPEGPIHAARKRQHKWARRYIRAIGPYGPKGPYLRLGPGPYGP